MPSTPTTIIGKIALIEAPPVAFPSWWATADGANKVTLAMTVATNSEIFSIVGAVLKIAKK